MTDHGEGRGHRRIAPKRVVGAGRATPAERSRRPPTHRPVAHQPVARTQTGPNPRRKPVARPRSRRLRAARLVWGGLALLVVGAVLWVFAFPTLTYLGQRHQLAVASQHLRLLNSQNATLSERISKLQTDAEIERLAREQYHLVLPGEQAFAVLPAPSPTTTAPPPTPHHAAPHRGLWSRTWSRLTSWL